MRIADFCWAPTYHLLGNVISATVFFVRVNLQPVYELPIYSSQLVSDNSRSLKKFSWASFFSATPKEIYFALDLSSCS